MRRLLSTAVGTLALAVGMVISTSGPAAAESAPGGGSVVQIGSTAYITTPSGQTAASVKQFKGCSKNWAYVYVWQSFRDTHSSWEIAAWIETSSSSLGGRASGGGEIWSNGTYTLDVCTRGAGYIKFDSQTRYGYTDTRC